MDTSKTPVFRASFPHLLEANTYQGNTRFSVVALWTPANFSDKDKELWKKMAALLDAACLERFKKPFAEIRKLDGYKTPIRKGENKAEYEGYGPGVVFATLSSKQRPGIVDKKLDAIGPERSDEIYPGVWLRATVNAYAYDNIGKGVAFGLQNVQKIRDDSNLAGRQSAEDDFGDDTPEFDDDMSGAADSDPLS